MRTSANFLVLAVVWVVSLILFGILARISWFFLHVGWSLLP